MTIAVILYKTNTLANGEHPLMLRITHKKIRKYVSLGLSCPAALWDFKRHQPRKHHPRKKLFEAIMAQKVASYHTKFLELIAENKTVSPQALITAVESPHTHPQFFPFLDELIDRLVKAGNIGNAKVYKDTRRTLRNFTHNTTILWTDIDQRFLNRYETYLRNRRLAATSLAVYFRTLSAIFNKAIKEQLVKATHYPFREFNVSKFNTTTQKRAITKEDMTNIAQLPIPPESPLYQAKQYFLFSYYGQGINFRDMALLRWRDLVEGRVFYQRAKTGKCLQFKLLPPAQAIVDAYRPQTPYDREAYIFPILNQHVHITPTQIDHRLEKC